MAMVEVLVAVVILGIGVLGTIAMQARAASAMTDASLRSEATMATEKLLSLIATDQNNATSYAMNAGGSPPAKVAAWYADTQARIPGAVISIAVTPAGGVSTLNTVVTTITWTRKTGEASLSHVVTSYVASSL